MEASSIRNDHLYTPFYSKRPNLSQLQIQMLKDTVNLIGIRVAGLPHQELMNNIIHFKPTAPCRFLNTLSSH